MKLTLSAIMAIVVMVLCTFGYIYAQECYHDIPMARDYRGYVNETKSGKPCQKWTAQSPHVHRFIPLVHPTSGLGDHNYCRNPSNEYIGPWCYTTESGKRWDYCDIGEPSESCQSRGEDECNTTCSRNYDPVCGTDGQTYSNKCHLEKQACLDDLDVKVHRHGECTCDDESGLPACQVNGLNVTCNDKGMKILLNKDMFPASIPTRAVHLQGSNCEARDVPGMNQIRISTGYDQCNTTQQRYGEYIVYSNTIIAKDPETYEEVCIEVECWMESVINVDLCVPCPAPCPRHVSSGKFTVHIHFYQNDLFHAPVRADYRMRVRRGDRVYVGVDFDGVNNLNLILDSCWVSSTDHGDGDPDAIYLIENRRALSGSRGNTILYDTSDPTNQRKFSFTTFSLEDNACTCMQGKCQMYLRCKAILCDPRENGCDQLEVALGMTGDTTTTVGARTIEVYPSIGEA